MATTKFHPTRRLAVVALTALLAVGGATACDDSSRSENEHDVSSTEPSAPASEDSK